MLKTVLTSAGDDVGVTITDLVYVVAEYNGQPVLRVGAGDEGQFEHAHSSQFSQLTENERGRSATIVE